MSQRMQSCDALFLLQCLFPICNPKKSGIENDARVPCQWMNMYVDGPDTDRGGTYGHKYDNTDEAELMHWFGVIRCD